MKSGPATRLAASLLPSVAIHALVLAAIGLAVPVLVAGDRVLELSVLLERPRKEPAAELSTVGTPEPVPEHERLASKAPVPRKLPREPEVPQPATGQPPVDPAGSPGVEAPAGGSPAASAVQPRPGDDAQPVAGAQPPASSSPPAPPAGAGTPAATTAAQGGSLSSGQAIAAVRNALQEHLIYPPIARIQGIEGTVKLQFGIDPSGMPTQVKVLKSSGFALLDEAALAAVKAAAPLPASGITVKVPVEFTLSAGS